MATLMELARHSSMRTWSDRPGHRLVKVLSPSARNHLAAGGGPLALGGYFTQEKYLYGMTASQIERVLGLRPGELAQMAYVYTFSRLPVLAEVDFRLSAAWPDGQAFDAAAMADFLKARETYMNQGDLYSRSMVPTLQYYPPGSGMIPQWCMARGVTISAGALLATVTSQFPFPRANGSIQPYRPHDRGAIR